MKAVVYEKYGAPNVLRIKEMIQPEPKENEIRVKIHTTTVTPADWRMRKADPFIVRFMNGLFKPQKQILGVEFAGEVDAVGNTVTSFKVGDHVFGYSGAGAYAEYLCLPEDGVVTRKPEKMSFEQAAALPLGALTALYFWRKGAIQPGQKVLVYGASGSVGTFAVQIAKALGASVTAVASTRNLELVQSLGADQVIDYTTVDYSEWNEQYDIIFDAVGKTTFTKARNVLQPNGYFVSTGFSPALMWRMMRNPKSGGQKVVVGSSTETREDLEYLKELVEKGQIQSVIDRSYTLAEVQEAHAFVEQGHKRGNVVLQVGL